MSASGPLHDGVRRLVGADAEADVYAATVEALLRSLDADRCAFAVARDDGLDVEAEAPGGDATGPLPRTCDVPGRSYCTGRSCVIDDLTDVRSAAAGPSGGASEPYRSLLCVPLADRGVVVAMARVPGAFDESDLDPAERLVTYAGAALDRLDSGPAAARRSDPDPVEEAASILSHDVGNPIAVARGHLELARTTGEDEHLDRVETAHGRLEELIEGVVTLLRTGRHAGGTDPVDLADAVDKARSAVDLGAADLEVADTATVEADRNALCRILENVFRNAVDHAGPDVRIRVGLLDGGFYVEDDGPGVPPGERDRVFEWGVSGSEDHTGAGLHIVERLVAAQGWNISLTEAADGGARFEITGVEPA